MLRTIVPALIAASTLLLAGPLAAEEAPTLAIVTGLSPGDLLNVRATASAFGVVLARLPNGANMTNHGCSDVSGYKWCKVEEVGNPQLSGWAPARYLHVPGADEPDLASMASAGQPAQEAAPAPAPEPAKDSPAEAPNPLTVGANGDNIFVPDKPPEADQPKQAAAVSGPPAPPGKNAEPATPATARPEVPAMATEGSPRSPVTPALPVDLMARLGADQAAAAPVHQKSAAAIGRTAAEDAYGLAFAARDKPAPAEAESLPPKGEEVSAQEATGGDAGATPAPDAIPIPTPRPDLPATADGSPAVPANTLPADTRTAELTTPGQEIDRTDPPFVDTQTVGQVEPRPAAAQMAAAPASAPAYDATGEIPCARYIGQPMTRCEASVARKGADAADITVTWPDGGTRTISFADGKPEHANSRGEFRFTREGNLNMIRVGVSERFEISDAVAFGD